MKNHLRRATGEKLQSIDDFEKYAQFQFDHETQKLHRELRDEIKKMKLENEINEQISKILERRLSELNEQV
jgi:hypothetical protein